MANPLLPFGNSLRSTPGLMQQQPRSFGDRVRGILGSIGQGAQGLGMGLLGAQERSELGPGLADFGARMLSASAPDARGTFGGALGDSLLGTRQELEYQRDLEEQEAQMQQAGQALQGYLPEDLQGMGLPPELIQSIALQRMMTPKQALNVGPGQVGVFDPVQGNVDIQGEAPLPPPAPLKFLPEQVVDGREVIRGVDPITGEELVEYRSDELPDEVMRMDPANRNEILAYSKDFENSVSEARTVNNMTQKLVETSPNQAGDISMMFAYMKILDSISTVREGEQQLVQNAGNLMERAQAQYNRLLTGDGRMDDTIRQQFKDEGLKLAATYRDYVDRQMSAHRNRAAQLGMDPSLVVMSDPLEGVRGLLPNPLTGR